MTIENNVVPVVVDTVVVSADTGKAISGQMKAKYTAEKQEVLAKDKLWADGVRAEMLESGATQREQVTSFLIAGMPADIRPLVRYSREEAKQISLSEGQRAIRREAKQRIGSQIRKYQNQLAKMAKAEEVTEEVTETKTPNQIMAGIIEGFLNDVKEAEDYPNVVPITKTGKAFIKALSS